MNANKVLSQQTYRSLVEDRRRLDFLERLLQGGSETVTVQEVPEGFRFYTERATTGIRESLRQAIDSAIGDERFY